MTPCLYVDTIFLLFIILGIVVNTIIIINLLVQFINWLYKKNISAFDNKVSWYLVFSLFLSAPFAYFAGQSSDLYCQEKDFLSAKQQLIQH
jgi:hypothetical protein